jgi:poly(3-hydroxyalkanoate) synthetase
MVLDGRGHRPEAGQGAGLQPRAAHDHIAPLPSVFKVGRHFGGKTRLVVAGSGHVAGVVNPPAARKYGYWTQR